jgi:Zn-dependent metalloprotease
MVKFRQTFNKIPVYGSYVTVELDKDNKCIGINSSMVPPRARPMSLRWRQLARWRWR